MWRTVLTSLAGALILAQGSFGQVPFPAGSAQSRLTANGMPLDIYTYKPQSYKKGSLLLVFHGLDRRPDATRNRCIKVAEEIGALVVAPNFDTERFPDRLYQGGGVKNKDGTVNPRDRWTFALVPSIISQVRSAEGRIDMPVYLMGQSAGAQFVARLAAVMDVGAARYVAANPSAWVFPTTELRWGYGFGGLPPDLSGEDNVRRYLAAPLTVYLGAADVKEENLDESKGAMMEGASRIERGRNFFNYGRRLAEAHGWTFNWKLVEVPGVGHGERGMYEGDRVQEALLGT